MTTKNEAATAAATTTVTAQTIRVWGEGKKQLWTPGKDGAEPGHVDIPNGFVEVQPGDAYTTHRIKLHCDVVYARMKRERGQRFSRCIGLLAPKAAVATAQREAKKTAAARAHARDVATQKRDAARAGRAAAITKVFPRLPAEHLEPVARRASAADVADAAAIAKLVEARALVTIDHDELVAKHGKAGAKAAAKRQVDALLTQWKKRAR